jgi:hypothetical protein
MDHAKDYSYLSSRSLLKKRKIGAEGGYGAQEERVES